MQHFLARMLALGLCLAVIAGCGSKQTTVETTLNDLPKAIDEAVDESIKDPAKAKAAKDEAVRLGYAVSALEDEMWNTRTRSFYLDANYDTDEADYDGFIAQLRESRAEMQGKLIDAALKARASMTEAEWTSFHDALSKKLDLDTSSIQKEAKQ